MDELRRISIAAEPVVRELPSQGPIKSSDVFSKASGA